MIHWQIPVEPNIPPELLDFAGDALLAQLLLQRGLSSIEQARAFLNPEVYQITPPAALPDIDQAIQRLRQAISQQEKICVWGDFDVDGQTSTALLVSTLQDLGAQVRSYIPNRLTESHGIKISALQQVLADEVELILTCDTGITEYEAVTTAQAAGVEVIITDHHDLGETLPPVQAVINPKRLTVDHPLRELPGVGVAYKVAEALYQSYGRAAADCYTLLDLVALGIVADVARQIGDTRYLLQQGLEQLNQSIRPGLQALIESANLKTKRLTEEHIGFWLAPRLNALGRLGDANLAVELLTTTNLSRARIIALQLEALNDRRKMLVDRVVIQALSQLEDTPSLAEYNAIVLAASDWHPGVIGIAANRLAEQYGKPAILIALRSNSLGRGSARSVAGCDIHQAIKRQADLLISFGGHPMAAGLSLAPENITTFRRSLSSALSDCRESLEKQVKLDLMVDLPQAAMPLLNTIQRLAPFGAGNPPVQLGCMGLKIVKESLFGKTRNHKRLTLEDESGYQQQIIWWGGAVERSPEGRFDLAFTLSPDDYKGEGAVQLEWRAARELEPVSITITPEFIDWRTNINPQSAISKLQAPIVWAEGISVANLSPLLRHQLQPAQTLVVWSAPPDHNIFQQAMALVKPQQTYLVGQPSPFDTFSPFIKQLMGLVKYSMSHKEGEVNLIVLASTLGHRVATIQLGIDWLVAQGKLEIYIEEDEILVLRSARRPPAETAEIIETILKSALAETAAYRRFFKTASLAALERVVE